VAATGVVSWYVAQPIAQQFDVTLSDPMQIGIGGVAALLALLVSKRALDFTQDCMTVPDVVAHGAIGAERAACRKKNCRSNATDGGASKGVAGCAADANGVADNKSAASADRVADNKSDASAGLTTTVSDHESMKVAVQTNDGVTTVTVTISGVSSAKFKDKQSGLRKKIEGVAGVTWSNPKNLGNGSREMVGRIRDNSSRETVIARLQALAASV
jgi:hypothetical protein